MRNVQLALNGAGCIQVTSRAVGETYWPDADDTLRAGRFHTSDLGELKNGLVFLRGRLNDQINVAGRKVSPATIEGALLAHEAVRDCLVFSVPSQDADRTDLIVACVAGAAPDSAETLKQSLLRKLPAWQVPREWWFVDSLGASPRGKVSRARWKKKFLERRQTGGAVT